ncbi:hypothetical protein BGZ70_008749 [Mortierella alpina]|uniref:Secreted protein n=1 Tax=Mortierella alpina TaxID=64518 RepID=A0A9P6M0H8_MORAP|nr:hypothetical protein BGZ70_008749 [Mortierella alpina]
MRTVPAIFTLVASVCLLSVQVAADQDAQSTFVNALSTDEHQDMMSPFDFLPIFLPAGAAAGGNSGESDNTQTPASPSANASPSEQSPDASLQGRCKDIKEQIAGFPERFEQMLEELAKGDGKEGDEPRKLSPTTTVVTSALHCAKEQLLVQMKKNPNGIDEVPLLKLLNMVTEICKNNESGDKKQEESSKWIDDKLFEFERLLDEVHVCADSDKGGSPQKMESAAHQCSLIAKFYRTLIPHAIAAAPDTKMASEDLKDAVNGAVMVLKLMKMTAPTDKQLSAPQPNAVPSSWLNQFRLQMAPWSEKDEEVQRFNEFLLHIGNIATASSACQTASNDPVGAAESLAEHLEA